MNRKRIISILLFVCIIMFALPSTTAFAKCAHAKTREKVTQKATLKKIGKVSVICRSCQKTVKVKKIAPVKSMTISKKTWIYDGKAHQLKIKVKDSKNKAIPAKYWSLDAVSAAGLKDIGEYTVTVKLKGMYAGKLTEKCKVIPSAPVMLNWDKNEGNFGLHWKCPKDNSQISGYEVQWADNASFKNAYSRKVAVDMIGFSGSLGVKNGKTYYCRIRSITIKNGKTYYSKWSNTEHDKYVGKDQDLSIHDEALSDIATGNAGAVGNNNTGSGSSNQNNGTSGGSSSGVSGTRVPCATCGGKGNTTITTMKTVVISFNPYMSIQQPVVNNIACGRCAGSGFVTLY